MPIYSHSRLSAFESCPRQYWYAYIGKPEIEEVETVEAFLGSRVHEALEALYSRLTGGRLVSEEQLLCLFEDGWDRNWNDGVRIVSQTFMADDYRQVGRESLKAYYRRYQPFDQSRTLRLEAQFIVNLDAEGKYRLQGYIDRLAQRADGAYEIHDYKTSRRLPAQAEADGDRQLALYQLGVEAMWPDVEHVDLVWHYLRFDKELRSIRTPEQLAAVKGRCIALIDDIESRGEEETGFPTSPSSLCDWCEFREICPATRHHVAVAALPPERFKSDAGVSLVDSLVAIRDRRGALEQEADALKAEEQVLEEQIIAFAQQQGLESVAGSSHRADIEQKVYVSYPHANDKDRPQFESFLRQAGLWEKVSVLSWASFKSLWQNPGLIPAAARRKLQPFVTESTETVARLKKVGAPEE